MEPLFKFIAVPGEPFRPINACVPEYCSATLARPGLRQRRGGPPGAGPHRERAAIDVRRPAVRLAAGPLKTTLPGPVSVTPLAVPLPLTRLPEKVRTLPPVAAEAMLSELLRVIVPL